MTIDPEARTPPYLQLAALIRQQIADGTIPVGRRIPSMHELETTHGLARNTIAKALRVLKDEGIIEPETGRGLFVVRVPDNETPADP